MDTGNEALRIYAENAEQLATRYETVDVDAVFAPLASLLPEAPACIADIGAGTGRDAAWLAARAHRVTAVEPTPGLRDAGIARHGDSLEWVSDTLPDLTALGNRTFDLIFVNAVWHHLDESSRQTAMSRLSKLTRAGGRILVSLRHGPLPKGQPIEPLDTEQEIDRAQRAGLQLVERIVTDSRQEHNRQADVTWTWLALEQRDIS